jgi:hypothetical protein
MMVSSLSLSVGNNVCSLINDCELGGPYITEGSSSQGRAWFYIRAIQVPVDPGGSRP